MTPHEALVAEIAGVLAEHEYMLGVVRGGICLCGHVPTIDPGSLQTQQDYHRNHLADLLAARDRRVAGEAWMEGTFYFGGDAAEQWYFNDGGSAQNPYQAEADQ